MQKLRNFINRYFQYMKVHQHQIRVYYNTAMSRLDFKQELRSPILFQYFSVSVILFKDHLVFDKYVFQMSLETQSPASEKTEYFMKSERKIYKILLRGYKSLALY